MRELAYSTVCIFQLSYIPILAYIIALLFVKIGGLGNLGHSTPSYSYYFVIPSISIVRGLDIVRYFPILKTSEATTLPFTGEHNDYNPQARRLSKQDQDHNPP